MSKMLKLMLYLKSDVAEPVTKAAIIEQFVKERYGYAMPEVPKYVTELVSRCANLARAGVPLVLLSNPEFVAEMQKLAKKPQFKIEEAKEVCHESVN